MLKLIYSTVPICTASNYYALAISNARLGLTVVQSEARGNFFLTLGETTAAPVGLLRSAPPQGGTNLIRVKQRILRCPGTGLGSGIIAGFWPHHPLPNHLPLGMPSSQRNFLPSPFCLSKHPQNPELAELNQCKLTLLAPDPAQLLAPSWCTKFVSILGQQKELTALKLLLQPGICCTDCCLIHRA